MNQLIRVGFGRVDITPADPVPLGGYGNSKLRFHETVRDNLYATCLAFTGTDNNTVLLFHTDMLHAYGDLTEPVREVLSAAYGIPKQNVLVAATHSHSTPDAMLTDIPAIAAFREKYVTSLIAAGHQAMADRAEALIYVCSCPTERMNFIRHYKIADGTYAGANFGNFAAGIVGHTSNNDAWMQLIKLVRPGTQDILLMNWQAHPCFTGGIDKKELSADYIGELRKYLEEKTGAKFAFFQGAAGNHNGISFYPRETRTNDCTEYARILGDYALWALQAPVYVQGGKVESIHRVLTLELDHSDDHMVPQCKDIYAQWYEKGDRPLSNKRAREELRLNSIYAVSAVLNRAARDTQEDMSIYAFRIGDLGFVCAPYEMFAASGMQIKEWSPYAMTFVVSCCNDTRGYLASELAYNHGCYEVDTRRYPKGCAEYLADTFVDMLKELKK